jgi:hypothetical protein
VHRAAIEHAAFVQRGFDRAASVECAFNGESCSRYAHGGDSRGGGKPIDRNGADVERRGNGRSVSADVERRGNGRSVAAARVRIGYAR